MKPAYIISAYKRPDLLIRLVKALDGRPIAIHVDRKSTIFGELYQALGSLHNLTFLPRHECHWGLFGHVRASLEGLTWFLSTQCDYAILLTGQCYPLKPQAEIEDDLHALAGRSIIEFAPFPLPRWQQDNGGYKRLNCFYFKAGAQPRFWHWRLHRYYLVLAGGIRLLRLKPWTRTVPLGLRPYGGSGYWCLSRDCVKYVAAFVRKHRSVVRFFSTTFVPDEMFFQTILANSPYKSELINAGVHYVDWSNGGASPAIISPAGLPAALASGAWFARKFDHIAMLDLVDEVRLDRSRTSPSPPWRVTNLRI